MALRGIVFGLDAWITKYGANYTFLQVRGSGFAQQNGREMAIAWKVYRHKDFTLIGQRMLMQLEIYNQSPTHEGKHQQSGYFNYFIGNDPSKHATNLGLYQEKNI